MRHSIGVRMLLSFAALSGCGPSTGGRATECIEPREERVVVTEEPLAPSSPEEAPEGTQAAPRVAVGACDVDWMPAGTVIDVSPAETEALAAAMRAWVAEGGVRDLLIDTRRGIAFAKSEDDLGGEPPYPQSTTAQSVLACGVSAMWLTESIRADFARAASPDFGGVTCHENVCCYSGMEFMSDGYLALHLETVGESPQWVVDTYVQVAEAALTEDRIASNRTEVARSMERERARTCRGEPAGHR